MKLSRMLLFTSAAALVALPLAALAFIKPLRVVAPSLMPGISCPRATICTDDVARLDDVETLYRDGYAKAVDTVGPFRQSPRAVFCTTARCADTFGMGRRAAEAVGNLGLVVAPRGWTAFYVAHELIHYRQAESLGNLAVATKPEWLIEGMAYSLSGDPRRPLGEPFEQWRSRFETWHSGLGGRDLWEAARDVR
ncbi:MULTISPECIES: hypothetical protein [Ralstonia solanacearum species complex]|uniref:hypothetical protein n=1 Tax=Ralstonia solanacearum species complex TaxID=3116862 RepID=UPI000E58DCD8|nr:hypothetical protein [Ralstonia solanacearum]AXV79296.1 hypothetical protein CJO76_20320 [Ralstonia solanacearum]AXV93317.1 hypothetical protein CJO79_20295 [Ralstonia solanacearum]AXW78215.1 hypothetical protein CJO97_20295 [Ralstonia solanacearum]BEU74434.1 hypothetical protein MAFF211271_39890 [Ralstonia pseudosolanacearum]